MPEKVQNTPWSNVVRFATSNGYIYLKHTPLLLALEAKIIQILHDQFHGSVPEVIAHHSQLNCFLMKDAGKRLREILKKEFNPALMCKAIDQFTSLQLAVADHIDVFLNIGVPDWRLEQLSELYSELLSQKEILVADGLSEIEIAELKTLVPTISNVCKKLSDYSIKQTMVQPDFHDNNTLVNDSLQELTIIDLGEIVISHPFFSLINCLQQMKKHHALTEEEEAYLAIKDACLTNFMKFESKKNVLAAFETAHRLMSVYGILAQYRLMVACDKEALLMFQRRGKLAQQFKELWAACVE